jgi:hypothetical protein
MQFEYIFFAIFALVVGNFAWRYFRSGSLTGAMLGGKITREVGQVSITSSTASSKSLKVHCMESSDGNSFVGLSLISKAPLAASMVPIKLSKSQAQELAQLLQQAITSK